VLPGQVTQTVAPATDEIAPGGQLMHCALTPYFPGAHGTHVDDALSNEYPSRHTHCSIALKLVLKDEVEFKGHDAHEGDPELICTL
jgi:hypothetical protein